MRIEFEGTSRPSSKDDVSVGSIDVHTGSSTLTIPDFTSFLPILFRVMKSMRECVSSTLPQEQQRLLGPTLDGLYSGGASYCQAWTSRLYFGPWGGDVQKLTEQLEYLQAILAISSNVGSSKPPGHARGLQVYWTCSQALLRCWP
jgi:hypothetical protein